MQQVKIFKGVENELVSLEQDINHWAAESKAKIISIMGNIAPQTHRDQSHAFGSSDVLIVVLYEATSG